MPSSSLEEPIASLAPNAGPNSWRHRRTRGARSVAPGNVSVAADAPFNPAVFIPRSRWRMSTVLGAHRSPTPRPHAAHADLSFYHQSEHIPGVSQHWWNWENVFLCVCVNFTFFFLFLKLGWNYSLFFPPHIHALATPIIVFLFFFADNKSEQDLCTTDYQGELFKAQITTLTPRW